MPRTIPYHGSAFWGHLLGRCPHGDSKDFLFWLDSVLSLHVASFPLFFMSVTKTALGSFGSGPGTG